MSCCVYSNMLAILAAFILRDQSKLPSQECRLGNTCNICTVNWMVFQHWLSLSSRSSHTHTRIHINTSNADTYRKPHVSEPRGFKAWPTNTFMIYFFSPTWAGFSDWPSNTQTKPSSLVFPTQFQSLRGSVSESRDVTATTWRQEM